jgi:hypothetical protein
MLCGAMNTDSNRFREDTPTPVVQPDFSGFDTAEDMYRDAVKWGLDEKLRALLCQDHAHDRDRGDAIRLAREIAYELAGAKNRDLAVDLFLHVTGLGEFGFSSLRDYGRKHGCSHEWIRREAEAMRERLDLPRLASQRSEEVRTEYRLVNRRNGGA